MRRDRPIRSGGVSCCACAHAAARAACCDCDWPSCSAPIDGHWTRSLEDFIDSCYPADVPRQQSKLWQHVFDEPEARTMFGPLHAEEWPSAPQIASLETIVQRVLSLSAVSEKPADEQAAIADEVRSLLASHPTSKGLELFELPHVVEVYWLDRLDG